MKVRSHSKKPAAAGDVWREAIKPVMWVDAKNELRPTISSGDLLRYGRALDRLAREVAPRLRNCNGGIWEGRPRSRMRRAMSLSYLSRQVIDACELARESYKVARQQPTVKLRLPRPSTRQITARDTKKAVKAARRLAKITRKWETYLWPRILMSTKPWLSAAEESPPQGPSEAHSAAWSEMRRHRPITAAEFANALDAIARVLDEEKPTRRKGGGHIGGPERETLLARDLSGWIRLATIGDREPKVAQWSYQDGTPLPQTGGWPGMASVTAFVQAVFPESRITADVLRNRLSALGT